VNFSRDVDGDTSLHAGMFYNGSAALFPDLPLPYFTYAGQVSEQLSIRVGFPNNSLAYRPMKKIQLDLDYTYPVNVEGRAAYAFNDVVQTFAQFTHSTDGFYMDGQAHERLLYTLDRLATGVRFQASWIDTSIGIGYTFQHAFESGYDIRDTEKIAELEDELLFMLKVQSRF